MGDEARVSRNYSGKLADRLLVELADAQHGVVGVSQLLERGFPRHWIEHQVSIARLRRAYRGVYSVSSASLSPLGRCLAAALAGGPEAVVGFYAAAWLWDLPASLPQTIHLRCPTRRADRPGLRFHSGVPRDERTVQDAVPVTIPARTLFDLAPLVESHRLERMLEAGEEARLPSGLSLIALLDRYPRKPGAPALRALLGRREEAGPRVLRSDPEAALLGFCDAHRIPRPLTNYPFTFGDRTFELDAFWPRERLAVEYDSWDFHGDRVSFRDDRIRDRVLSRAGLRVVRATAFDLGPGAAAFAADLRDLLGLVPA